MMYDLHGTGAGLGGLADPHQGTLMLGRVESLSDEEGIARVQVSFPLHTDDDEQKTLAWAPVATPFAGKDYGAFLLPNVEDVVVLGFLSNDPRTPVVLGSVWHGEARSTESLAGETVERWSMVGRKGTRIAIIEEDDTPKVELSTKAGVSITVSDEGGGTVEISSNGSTISMSTSEISLQASTIAMDASEFRISSGSVTVSAPAATFSGCISSQVSQATTVVASTYTPGAGNLL